MARRLHISHTEATDPDFMELCTELDRHLNNEAGGPDKRVDYATLCVFEGLEDAFVAYADGRTAGCAALKEYAPEVAEVKRVFVKPFARRTGVARELMRTLEIKARERGFHTLLLETGRSFTPAVTLYRELGFERIPNYSPYEHMTKSICMKKRLDKPAKD